MKIIKLDEAKENPLECEEFQLKNWLRTLSEYFKKDTPMKIKKVVLSGKNCKYRFLTLPMDESRGFSGTR